MAKNDYQTILIEQLADQNTAILEYVGELPSIKRAIVQLKKDGAELKSDMKLVMAAVTDMSQHLADHERRIARLEAA
jgi:hypothetical protein